MKSETTTKRNHNNQQNVCKCFCQFTHEKANNFNEKINSKLSVQFYIDVDEHSQCLFAETSKIHYLFEQNKYVVRGKTVKKTNFLVLIS